jgi:hypothetical protein
MPNVHELIRDHVTLSTRCLDRLHLHAYLPTLQASGGPTCGTRTASRRCTTPPRAATTR